MCSRVAILGHHGVHEKLFRDWTRQRIRDLRLATEGVTHPRGGWSKQIHHNTGHTDISPTNEQAFSPPRRRGYPGVCLGGWRRGDLRKRGGGCICACVCVCLRVWCVSPCVYARVRVCVHVYVCTCVLVRYRNRLMHCHRVSVRMSVCMHMCEQVYMRASVCVTM